MPRDGAIIFGDLIGKLSVIRVERAKAVWAVPANVAEIEGCGTPRTRRSSCSIKGPFENGAPNSVI